MARLFDDGSNQYLTHSAALLSAYPFTLSGWFNTNDSSINGYIVSVKDDAGSNGVALWIRDDPDNDVVIYITNTSGQFATSTGSGYSTDTWHHAAGVVTSSTARAAFMDGGNKGTDADSLAFPAGLDNTTIGIEKTGLVFPFSGSLAEIGIWNVALADAEIAILGAGYSPLFVRPQSLVAYWQLFGDNSPEPDIVGGYDMTLMNGPTQATHPIIDYPIRTLFTIPDIGGMITV